MRKQFSSTSSLICTTSLRTGGYKIVQNHAYKSVQSRRTLLHLVRTWRHLCQVYTIRCLRRGIPIDWFSTPQYVHFIQVYSSHFLRKNDSKLCSLWISHMSYTLLRFTSSARTRITTKKEHFRLVHVLSENICTDAMNELGNSGKFSF